jgi:hypothetical protein
MRSGLYLATMLTVSSLAAAEIPLTIDQLLAQGWEIAGYASGYDNRTSLILFRHPGVNTLVQCGILYDVTQYFPRQSVEQFIHPFGPSIDIFDDDAYCFFCRKIIRYIDASTLARRDIALLQHCAFNASCKSDSIHCASADTSGENCDLIGLT